jgi:hypothetical protein
VPFTFVLVAAATALMAHHCGPDSDCGHEGGDCDIEVVCTFLEEIGVDPGSNTLCFGDQATGGGGGGGGGGSAYLGALQGLTGFYSYEIVQTQCQGSFYIKDPISVVAFPFPGVTAEDHLIHHGWSAQASLGQYFHDAGVCAEGEISRGTNDLPFSNRYHARGHFLGDTDDLPVLYTLLGTAGCAPNPCKRDVYSLTPHYDDYILFCGHAVPEDMDEETPGDQSGFSKARDELLLQWHGDGSHRFVGFDIWPNTERITQECGSDRPRLDGRVIYVE